jgi:hypothetical protein
MTNPSTKKKVFPTARGLTFQEVDGQRFTLLHYLFIIVPNQLYLPIG